MSYIGKVGLRAPKRRRPSDGLVQVVSDWDISDERANYRAMARYVSASHSRLELPEYQGGLALAGGTGWLSRTEPVLTPAQAEAFHRSR